MNSHRDTDITIDQPGELLASVPHLLGFHPVDSLVVVGLTGPATTINVVLRADLPPPTLARELAEYLLLPLSQHRSTAVVMVVVGGRPHDDDLPHRELLARCESVLADRGFPVVHQLWVPATVTGRRWHCYDDDGCAGILPDPDGTELAAAVAEAGLTTYQRREDIAASLTPEPADVLGRRAAALNRLADTTEPGTPTPESGLTEWKFGRSDHTELGTPDADRPGRAPVSGGRDGPDPAGVESAGVEWAGVESADVDPAGPDPALARLADVEAAIEAASTRPPTPSDDDVIRLTAALADHRIRDVCLDFDDLPDVAAAERLWTALARATPAPESAEPACLLAFSAYARGDGVLAGIALAHAEAADPGHRLSGLLRNALSLGLSPVQLRVAGVRAATFARQALAGDRPDIAMPDTSVDGTPSTAVPTRQAVSTRQEES